MAAVVTLVPAIRTGPLGKVCATRCASITANSLWQLLFSPIPVRRRRRMNCSIARGWSARLSALRDVRRPDDDDASKSRIESLGGSFAKICSVPRCSARPRRGHASSASGRIDLDCSQAAGTDACRYTGSSNRPEIKPVESMSPPWFTASAPPSEVRWRQAQCRPTVYASSAAEPFQRSLISVGRRPRALPSASQPPLLCVQRVPTTSISTRRSGCRQAMSLTFAALPLQSPGLVCGVDSPLPAEAIFPASTLPDATR